MWESLNEEERDWILNARRPGNISTEESLIHKTLRSLVQRGLLQPSTDKSSFILFSEGFSQYIREYVKALENDYEKIERDIRNEYLKLTAKHIKSTLAHLSRLNQEWKRREKKGIAIENTYKKCQRLSLIFHELHQLYQTLGEPDHLSSMTLEDTPEARKAENIMSILVGYFEQFDWFSKHTDKIHIETGMKLMDQLIGYLELHGRQRIFGNSFDKILALRIEFMKHHKPENFSDFDDKVSRTFDRLVQVHDYSRASHMLRVRKNKFIQTLADCFFRCPIKTISAVIVIPFLISYGTAAWLYSYNQEELGNWAWTFMFWIYTYLFIFMHKPLISVKYCDFPNSKHLYRKLFSIRPYIYAILGYIIILNFIKNHLEPFYEHPIVILALGCLMGFGFVLLISYCFIKPKVLLFPIAFRRAAYFCSVEYFKGFYLALLITIIWYSIHLFYAGVPNVMGDIAEQTAEQWYWPITKFPFKLSFSFPLVVAFAFLAPVVGITRFFPKKTTD